MQYRQKVSKSIAILLVPRYIEVSSVSPSTSIYTAELAELAYKYGVMLHVFADDTQLYLHCRTNQAEASVEALERCIDSIISCWMSANRLRLNTDKTELIWTGAKSKLVKRVKADCIYT